MRRLVRNRANRENTASNLGKAACGTVLAGSLLVGGPMLSVREAHAQEELSLRERAARGQAWQVAKAAEKQGKWLEAADKYLEAHAPGELERMLIDEPIRAGITDVETDPLHSVESDIETIKEIYRKLIVYYTNVEDNRAQRDKFTRKIADVEGIRSRYLRPEAREDAPPEEEAVPEEEPEPVADVEEEETVGGRFRFRGDVELLEPEEEEEASRLVARGIPFPLVYARDARFALRGEAIEINESGEAYFSGGLPEGFDLDVLSIEATSRVWRGLVLNAGYQHLSLDSEFQHNPDELFRSEINESRILAGVGLCGTNIEDDTLYAEIGVIVPVNTSWSLVREGASGTTFPVKNRTMPKVAGKFAIRVTDRSSIYLRASNDRLLPNVLMLEFENLPAIARGTNSLLDIAAYWTKPYTQDSTTNPAFEYGAHIVGRVNANVPILRFASWLALSGIVGGEMRLRANQKTETSVPLGLGFVFPYGQVAGGYDPIGKQPVIWLTFYGPSEMGNGLFGVVAGSASRINSPHAAFATGYRGQR